MVYRLGTLYKLVKKIKPNERKYILNILKSEFIRIQNAPGGLHKHQNWRGGYIDHLVETMLIACLLFKSLDTQRHLGFTLSDALYVLFLHDFEKIYKMSIDQRGRPVRTPLANNPKYRSARIILKRLKIPLTRIQLNALTYVEGENNDYHPTKRIMNPLAAFVHCCDTISARVWFNEPKKSGLMKESCCDI